MLKEIGNTQTAELKISRSSLFDKFPTQFSLTPIVEFANSFLLFIISLKRSSNALFVNGAINHHVFPLSDAVCAVGLLRFNRRITPTYLGFCYPAEEDYARLAAWLQDRALEHDRPVLLLQLLCERFLADKLVRPGFSVVERMVATARTATEAEIYNRLLPVLDEVRTLPVSFPPWQKYGSNIWRYLSLAWQKGVSVCSVKRNWKPDNSIS